MKFNFNKIAEELKPYTEFGGKYNEFLSLESFYIHADEIVVEKTGEFRGLVLRDGPKVFFEDANHYMPHTSAYTYKGEERKLLDHGIPVLSWQHEETSGGHVMWLTPREIRSLKNSYYYVENSELFNTLFHRKPSSQKPANTLAEHLGYRSYNNKFDDKDLYENKLHAFLNFSEGDGYQNLTHVWVGAPEFEDNGEVCFLALEQAVRVALDQITVNAFSVLGSYFEADDIKPELLK